MRTSQKQLDHRDLYRHQGAELFGAEEKCGEEGTSRLVLRTESHDDDNDDGDDMMVVVMVMVLLLVLVMMILRVLVVMMMLMVIVD